MDRATFKKAYENGIDILIRPDAFDQRVYVRFTKGLLNKEIGIRYEDICGVKNNDVILFAVKVQLDHFIVDVKREMTSPVILDKELEKEEFNCENYI